MEDDFTCTDLNWIICDGVLGPEACILVLSQTYGQKGKSRGNSKCIGSIRKSNANTEGMTGDAINSKMGCAEHKPAEMEKMMNTNDTKGKKKSIARMS